MDPTNLETPDDATFGHVLTRLMHHGLVMVGVEICTGLGINGHHALSVQHSSHFVTNQLDTRKNRFH